MAVLDPRLDPDYRYSINRFTGTGAQTIWNLNFAGGFISRDHIKAYLENANGTLTALGFGWISDSSVNVTPAVASGQAFIFYRDTPKNTPLVDFEGGSALTERNLDTTAKQAIFVGAETIDRFADVGDRMRAATATSLAAVTTANSANVKADAAVATANTANTTANGAIAVANSTEAGFTALEATITNLLGADLTGLARLDTSQVYTKRQQINAEFGVFNPAGTIGVELLFDGTYRTYASGVYGTPRSFHDWDLLIGKPATFAPSYHTQDWATITGKPSTFAPAAHTHAYADITGKPSTFAPSAHTHPWSEITGRDNVRDIIVSTSTPSGGSDGNVWLQYAA